MSRRSHCFLFAVVAVRMNPKRSRGEERGHVIAGADAVDPLAPYQDDAVGHVEVAGLRDASTAA